MSDESNEVIEQVPDNNQVDADLIKKLTSGNGLNILNDIYMTITIEIGRSQIKIRDLLNLSKDSIIELNKSTSDPVDIYANGKLIANGNITSVNGKYCVKLTSVVQHDKTIKGD